MSERVCPSCGSEMERVRQRSLNVVMSGEAGDCDVDCDDGDEHTAWRCDACGYSERADDVD